jgi:hypothetical protein
MSTKTGRRRTRTARRWSGLDYSAQHFPYDADGSVTIRLPKGNYLVEHWVFTEADNQHGNLIVQPGVVLDRDQTVDVNPAITRPVSVTSPVAATLGWVRSPTNCSSAAGTSVAAS